MYSTYVCVVITLLFLFGSSNGNVNNYEYIWYHEMGNVCNTHRRIPSIPTNYTGNSWQLTFSASKNIMSIAGLAAPGINGDIYLFTSDDSMRSPEYLICITTNGFIRWKLYLERDSQMNNSAISNIVSNEDGTLFFTISWQKDEQYLNKICRISNANTTNPIEECSVNRNLTQSFQSPLSIDDLSLFLFTTIYGEAIAVINTTDLQILWSDKTHLGVINSHYTSDGTGIFWIGYDDHFRKVNGRDLSIIDVSINRGGNQYYAFNQQRDVVVRVAQNFSIISNPIILSEYDVKISSYFHLLWQWNEPNERNSPVTHPVIDGTGITYISILPYFYAIDTSGQTIWQSQITTEDEISKYNLQTFCLALNTETNLAYIVLFSSQQIESILFIVPIRTTTGDVLPRFNIEVPKKTTFLPNCPILIGNEMIYFPWFVTNDTNALQLNINGFSQFTF